MSTQHEDKIGLDAIESQIKNAIGCYVGSDTLRTLIALARKAQEPAIPEGMALVPINPPTTLVVAIEEAIDSQLVASAIEPAKMFRQDGHRIYDAIIAAAKETTHV